MDSIKSGKNICKLVIWSFVFACFGGVGLGALAAKKTAKKQKKLPAVVKFYYEQCIEADNVVSCAKAGVHFEKRGMFKKAIVCYKKACYHEKRPQGAACYLMGLMTRKTPKVSLKSFKRACKLKDGDGCTTVGEWLLRQDRKKLKKIRKETAKKAQAYHYKGCTLKDGRGCHRLARHYIAIKKNKLGRQYLLRSCQFGYPAGCGYLGWIFEVKKKKPNVAKKLYLAGCKMGARVECARLGLLFVKLKKIKEAKRYLQLSCKKGFALACRKLAKLAKKPPKKR